MKIKRHISLLTLAVFLGLLGSLPIFAQVQAQQGTSDSFTYMIPFPATELDAFFNAGFDGSSWENTNFTPPAPFTYSPIEGDDIVNVISIAVARDDTIIYYDQWEDGLENILTSPIQPSTQIWGDGDPSNGTAPTDRTPQDDILQAGDVLRLRNRMAQALVGDIAQGYFDGGDVLTAENGPLGVTYAAWPFHLPAAGTVDNNIQILYAGAWSLLSTNRWGTNYIIPIGEDLAPPLPAQPYPFPLALPPLDGTQAGFRNVGFTVQALQANTTVTIDLNDGTGPRPPVTLGYGENFTVVTGVNSGATVDADGPVQVQLLTANPAGIWEARAYTLLSREKWRSDYLAPRSSNGAFWVYNPNGGAIDVNITTLTGTDTINVQANSALKYPQNAYTITLETGARFTSSDDFYVLAALDAIDIRDWGYEVFPVEFLTTQYLVPWGPGNAPGGDVSPGAANGDESPVYVTSPDNTIGVNVIYADRTTANVSVSPLAEFSITDPNNDMTGAFLYTTNPDDVFAVVWGQDYTAPPPLPSIDVGTGIIPLASLTIQKTFELLEDADCTGSISAGDTVQFSLEYFNNAAYGIDAVNLFDELPASLGYVPNSIVLNGTGIPDATGTSLFQSSGLDIGSVNARGVGELTFNAVLNDASGSIVNRAVVRSPSAAFDDTVTVLVPTGGTDPILLLNYALVDPTTGPAIVGQVITFNLSIQNAGPTSVLILPLQVTFNPDDLSFANASVNPDSQNPGQLDWTDLTTTFGTLAPSGTISLTTSFVVNRVPANNSTTVGATVLEAEVEAPLPPLVCRTEAAANIGQPPPPTPTPTPTPTPKPTSPPSGGGDRGRDADTPTPSPPAATPVAEAIAPPAPELPVAFLPETGLREMALTGRGLGLFGGTVLLVTLSGAVAIILYVRGKTRKK